jgi:hypothetical protein
MPTTTLSGAPAPSRVYAPRAAKQIVGNSWLRLLIVPVAIGLTQAPWWWETVTGWEQRGPVSVVALVPVLALLAGWRTLRGDPPGRQIHDRQLDLILCLLITVVAAGLLMLAPGGRSLEAAGASSLTAGAIVVAGWGSRTLWQVRWPIFLLLLTWIEPWAQLIHLLSPLVARLAVEVGRIASPALVHVTTPSGGWGSRPRAPRVGCWIRPPAAAFSWWSSPAFCAGSLRRAAAEAGRGVSAPSRWRSRRERSSPGLSGWYASSGQRAAHKPLSTRGHRAWCTGGLCSSLCSSLLSPRSLGFSSAVHEVSAPGPIKGPLLERLAA